MQMKAGAEEKKKQSSMLLTKSAETLIRAGRELSTS